jgi:hypothetical protein
VTADHLQTPGRALDGPHPRVGQVLSLVISSTSPA